MRASAMRLSLAWAKFYLPGLTRGTNASDNSTGQPEQ